MVNSDIFLIYILLLCSYQHGHSAGPPNTCTEGWKDLKGDGNCDAILNNADCEFDGGDCCDCTCVDTSDNICGSSGFNCLDTNATLSCAGELREQFLNYTGDLAFFGDGSCDYENNNENCGYDGGDCCECTCASGSYYSCDDDSFNCMDPDAPCFDPNAVPVYPNCTDGSVGTIGDSICDEENNSEACGYDEGDCCSCTCTGGQYDSCGLYDFNCLDPDSPKELYNCAETPPASPPCSGEVQREWVVENTSQALLFSEAVFCSGGAFSVKWVGHIVVTATILVANGTMVNITGDGSGSAAIDGGNTVRLFTVVNSSLHVSNMVVGNGSASSGGAVAASGSIVTFNQTSFVGNTTPNGGGVMFVAEGSTVVFHGKSYFFNNSAGGNGGGIYVLQESSVSFLGDAIFDANSASRGGAIFSTGQSVIAWYNKSTFSDNFATTRGGAVCIDGSSKASWAGETAFSGNVAGSGAVYVEEDSYAYWGGATRFSGNKADTAGGAVRVTKGGKVSWSANMIFDQNIALEDGGALAVTADSSSASWSGETTFSGNTAFDDGGALIAAATSIIRWTSCTRFVNNSGEVHGGALFVTANSSVTWTGDTAFFNNTARTGRGGAIHINGGSAMEWKGETIFLSNTAGLDGGAVSSFSYDADALISLPFETLSDAESTLEVNGATIFTDNSCEGNGGGLALLGALAVSFGSTDVIFSRNSAAVSGGAVFIASTATGPVFTNVRFDSNSAQMGGGVYATGSGTATLQDVHSATKFLECIFVGNTAAATGGAIESAAGVDVIKNSFFYRNEAQTGGALRLAGTATLENCSFVENVSGLDKGPAVSNIGYMNDIRQCFFRGNIFQCAPSEYLDFHDGKNIRDTICNGCTECLTCSFAKPELVPTCTTTMENTESLGGTNTLENIVVYAGYWRASNTSKNILPCHNPDACPKGVSSGSCTPGYEGPYCSVCSKNYAANPQYTCRRCSDKRGGVTLVVVLAISGIILVVMVFLHLVSGDGDSTGPGIVKRLWRIIPLQSVKIVIVAWQILTQFASVANVTYPEVYRRLLDAVDVLNFDLSWVFSTDCFFEVDHHDRMFIMTVGPIITILLLAMTYAIGIWKNWGSEEALHNIRHKHVSMVLLVTFLVYSSVSSVLFQMFNCDHLDDGNNYLRADYRIDCDSHKHKRLQIYAGVMIMVFPVGIPALYAYLLFRSRTILMDETRRQNDVTVEPTSDLWDPYKPSRFFYEIIECTRRITLTSVVLLIEDDTAAQVASVLMIAFIFAVLFEVLAPYQSNMNTWVSRMGHTVIFSSMYFALLLKVEVSDETNASQRAFEIILVTSHACMILAVVSEAIIVACSLRLSVPQNPRRCNRFCHCFWNEKIFLPEGKIPPVETFDLELTVRPAKSAFGQDEAAGEDIVFR